jgi:hypothetical protein
MARRCLQFDCRIGQPPAPPDTLLGTSLVPTVVAGPGGSTLTLPRYVVDPSVVAQGGNAVQVYNAQLTAFAARVTRWNGVYDRLMGTKPAPSAQAAPKGKQPLASGSPAAAKAAVKDGAKKPAKAKPAKVVKAKTTKAVSAKAEKPKKIASAKPKKSPVVKAVKEPAKPVKSVKPAPPKPTPTKPVKRK